MDRRRPYFVRRVAGFTLLELMVSVAILAMATIYLFDAVTKSPDRANKAKLMTVATFLARAKLVETEAHLLKDGWEDFDDQECGDFNEEEYGNLGRFSWCVTVEKVELPDTVNLDQVIGKLLGLGGDEAGGVGGLLGGAGSAPSDSGGKASAPTTDPNAGMQGLITSMLSTMFSAFKNVVEQAIRQVTVRVFWKYAGKERSVKIYYYVTRPDVVAQAIIGGFTAPGATPGGAPPGGMTP